MDSAPKSSLPPFALFMCCLGNGVTYCNKAKCDPETRDYKIIAHSNEAGVLAWYIDPRTIPAEGREVIEKSAAREHERWLKIWDAKPLATQYAFLLDIMDITELCDWNDYWLAIPQPRDLSALVAEILSGARCKAAHKCYGLPITVTSKLRG